MRKRLGVIAIVAPLLAGLAFLGGRSQAATTLPAPGQTTYVYSVKFLCGLQQISSAAFTQPAEPIVKPGNYATVVNVQNVLGAGVAIVKRAVIAVPETASTNGRSTVGQPHLLKLSPGEALEVDCADIATLVPPPASGTTLPSFIDGFVDIASPVQLSVTAAYTSQTCLDPIVVSSTGTTGGCKQLGNLALDVVPQRPLAVGGRIVP